MADNDTHTDDATTTDETPTEDTDGTVREADGGTVTQAGRDHRDTDYLDAEVNLLRPSTPFMRDHLRIIWAGFVGWLLVVFGPPTATAIAPDLMTTTIPVIDFPLHYFLVAVGGPGGALVLSFWYARKRDQLDEKYDIEHSVSTGGTGGGSTGGATATDGGEQA